MNSVIKNRLHCEADDLIRLFKSGQGPQLERTARILATHIDTIYATMEHRYEKDNLGIAVKMGEYLALKALCSVMTSYLEGETTGKANKLHDKYCPLKDII
jgi:hypothetical protein